MVKQLRLRTVYLHSLAMTISSIQFIIIVKHANVRIDHMYIVLRRTHALAYMHPHTYRENERNEEGEKGYIHIDKKIASETT